MSIVSRASTDSWASPSAHVHLARVAPKNEVLTLLWSHHSEMVSELYAAIAEIVRQRKQTSKGAFLILHELYGLTETERAARSADINSFLRLAPDSFANKMQQLRALARFEHGAHCTFKLLEIEEIVALYNVQHLQEVTFSFAYVDVSSEAPLFERIAREREATEAFFTNWYRGGNLSTNHSLCALLKQVVELIEARGEMIHLRDELVRSQTQGHRETLVSTTPILLIMGSLHSSIFEPSEATPLIHVDTTAQPDPFSLACKRAAFGHDVSREEGEHSITFFALSALVVAQRSLSTSAASSLAAEIFSDIGGKGVHRFLEVFSLMLQSQNAKGIAPVEVAVAALESILPATKRS